MEWDGLGGRRHMRSFRIERSVEVESDVVVDKKFI